MGSDVEDHPDAAWVGHTISALQAWLERPASTATSQVTGGGAVREAERLLGDLHGSRPTVLVPNATFGMLTLLASWGIGPGDEVLIPAVDWTATLAVVRTLGATPIPVPVDERTWTIDPRAAQALRGRSTRAVVACHLLGIPADVPGLRTALPGLRVAEDCAPAFGSTLDGTPVGALGDGAVFSFGPGKEPVDVGEAGAIVVPGEAARERVLRQCAHPVGQKVGGIADPSLAPLAGRVHPVAAVMLAQALGRIDMAALRVRHADVADRVRALGVAVLGDDERRAPATTFVAATPGAGVVHAGDAGLVAHDRPLQDIRALIAGDSEDRHAVVWAAGR